MVGPAGSSLTTIAGSTSALKWDPPLTRLSDCRPSIIIMFFLFAFWEEAPFFKSREQRQLCHLTCVGAEALPVLSLPVPAGTTLVSEPLLWSWDDRQHGSVCSGKRQRVCSLTSDLDCDLSWKG